MNNETNFFLESKKEEHTHTKEICDKIRKKSIKQI